MLNQTQLARCKAFTLIELLVVISIILIASSIIFIGGNSGAGSALSSSLRIVSGIAQGARGQAILKNAETRLIIHNDPSDLEKYRRFFGIVYEDNDNSGQWIAATQGTYLPDGIYFDPTLLSSASSSRMNLEYPRINAVSESGSNYYYYTFNSNGTSANANDWLPIRAGNLDATGALVPYDSAGETASLKAALIFRQAGTTTPVTDPDAVK
ncbi:MAG: prepilin-type N-terminal cleavage/methylation domain-containing protein [Opitutae bacterium]|nr:prepilin-type N-terminal cleavage/methylation domain-containing protein [Opitutae bacterium]